MTKMQADYNKNLRGLKLHLAEMLSEITNCQIKFLKPAKFEMGDFATSVAMQVAKELKRNPLEIASEIVSKLEKPEYIRTIEVAKPGFINFFLDWQFIAEQLTSEKFLNCSLDAPRKKSIVEYSSVNVAKPLAVHHLLSTVIGQSITNLKRAVGEEVIAWNYLGDWGTQFGKVIYAYKSWGDLAVIERNPIEELFKLYVEFHKKEEEDDSLEDLGRAEFLKLEQGDPENRRIWDFIRKASVRALGEVYAKLGGIEFDTDSGEADREAELPEIISSGLEQKVFTVGEGGSIIADLTAENLPVALVQKSDGATLYATRDIASIKYRIEEFKVDEIVYVVDNAQSLHFKQLFAIVAKFDWFLNKKAVSLKHLNFGRMSFTDVKMSTRKGTVVHLEKLIDEAIKRAKDIIIEKNPALENLEKTAEIVGVGALKYSALMQSPETDVVFDFEKILSFEGNSAPYLQYSFARANSILGQSPELEDVTESLDLAMAGVPEQTLARKLVQFNEVVQEAAAKLKPNLVANYLFDLAQEFNGFYSQCPILKAQTVNEKNCRLRLTKNFSQAMKQGLHLLSGIEAPGKM